MAWGLGGAFAAAFLYGVATVLQARAIRPTATATELDPRLLVQLLKSGTFVVAILCDVAGFALSLVALRTLPLFVVQAVVSSSLAVTALLAWIFLRHRLQGREWAALAVVCVGLILLAVAAGPQRGGGVELSGRVALLASVGLLALVAVVAAHTRRSGTSGSAWALAVLAGIGYGVAGIGARILVHPGSLTGLLTDPAAYAIAAGGLLAMLLYAQALQRGSVTVATAAVVATETLFPAAVGLFLLDDRPRRGFVAVSAVGFALTVIGALTLARFGEPAAPRKDRGEPLVAAVSEPGREPAPPPSSAVPPRRPSGRFDP